MIHVRFESGVVKWQPAEFQSAFAEGRVTALTEVSVDDGKTWTTAAAASKWLELKRGSDAAVSLIVPVGVDGRAVIAGYFAVASFFMFGGPVVFMAGLFATDTGPNPLVRIGAQLVAFLLGPLPIAGFGYWALRSLREDASRRGIGRVYFAFVVAAVLTFPLVFGLVKILFG